MSTDRLPKYDEPPVVETVLGVQFERLLGFTAAHAGWFWKQYLGGDWPTAAEATPIEDVFERFGDEKQFILRRLEFKANLHSPRIQFVNCDDDRMVQVQDTRLHYNWRKRESLYPSYVACIGGFEDALTALAQFCNDAGFGELKMNQWEVTYVNHIPRGDLWQHPCDWIKIIPDICVPKGKPGELMPDGLAMNASSVIGDALGRLHTAFEHVRVGGVDGPDAIKLAITARGPISGDPRSSLKAGLDLGHEAIVNYFTDMTSELAHQYWKRRQ